MSDRSDTLVNSNISSELDLEDDKWMARALEEGWKGAGLTSPNPAVGAVVVKDQKELGAGYHQKAGLPHAEREAIADVVAKHGEDALKGATIYVTLEPCSTAGRTPACTSGILENGIARVVYGAVDPNPDHAGAADSLLKSKGVEISSGVLRERCELLLRPFAKRITTGLPWVVAKTAMSLDGRITRPPSEGQWLTSPESREIVHQLRAQVDAIIVGGKTVRRDNPRLTLRSENNSPNKQQPWRVVLTYSGRESLPQEFHLFTDEHKERTLIYQDKPLEEVLRDLADHDCNSVLLECGGKLMRQFAEAELIDEYQLFYAPIITGGEDFGFGLGDHFKSSLRLKEVSSQSIGQDTLIRGVVDRG
ncbi:bifunctional diaminohydroxyphosphoribosylaminopyrimidine deaminase/5-amino-6-(5-phosphoribosylamino)uracil reductase RibD [Rubritalea sp.]|uniref:bifunctional diaminohydroxyphosphoribosylaminopyrimidine deaminase/5-amino-6-(5-phosphoribosylamino)uracil reductase RibD n=1 Tax=Rubritalea sp. TaxID=2109375 RepID=UPI003EF8F358